MMITATILPSDAMEKDACVLSDCIVKAKSGEIELCTSSGWGQGSVVGIAIMLRTERFGVEPHWVQGIFYSGSYPTFTTIKPASFPGG